MKSFFFRSFLFVTLLLFFSTFSLAQAATIRVPSDYPTIQLAINAAQLYDTILVADGTYTGNGNRDIDFHGKSLTVKSEHGPASTIIDCQGTASSRHRGFYANNSEKIVVINGFTVNHGFPDGYSGEGGGAYIRGYNVSVTNCIFSNNTAYINGGAYIEGYDSVSVTNCTFSGNTTSDDKSSSGSNGGAYIRGGGDLSVANCTFNDNTAGGDNGGANIEDYDYTAGMNCSVTNCTFKNNVAYGDSGGAKVTSNAAVSMMNCTFSGNTANGDGSASSGYGGGAYIYGYKSTAVTNSTFSDNIARRGGGGAYVSGNPTVTNCTFTRNVARGNTESAGGGGVFLTGNTITVTNCIAWGDMASFFGEFEFMTNSNSTVLVTYCDIQGGYSGKGNINADPKFVNAATGDLHLPLTSPCLDSGTQAGAPAADRDGTIRPDPPSMGAYDIAITIKALVLSPASVYGGERSTGTFTLSRLAPASGTKVILGSNTGYAVVSSSATVPAGATSKTFTVTTNPVTAAKAATITASASGVSKTAALLIYPPALKFLTLAPSTVKGGKQNSIGTVTLTSAAPAGGVIISLSSQAPWRATVPVSATVPAGSRTATFAVTSKTVTTTGTLAITATAGVARQSANLTVTP